MKRGQGFSIETIVIVLLSLVAVVIIIMVMRQQITSGANKYTEIGGETNFSSDKCASIILGRGCYANEAACADVKKSRVYHPTGKQWDCASGQVCCQ